MDKPFDIPEIKAPENKTKQDMWAQFFTELQRLETEFLNPARLEVFNYNPVSLSKYFRILKTVTLMLYGFLKKDFPETVERIDKLFDKYTSLMKEADSMKKNSPNQRLVQEDLSKIYYDALQCLEVIDKLITIVRKEKGLYPKEEVTFSINDRVKKAIEINTNVTDKILKMFRQKKKLKERPEMVRVNKEADDLLNEDEELSE